MMAFFFMVALAYKSGIAHGTVLVVVEEAVAGGETVGIVGAAAMGAMTPAIGDTLGGGTVPQELTPRLLTSVESSGIPLRAFVVDEVDVGDDEATLVEPEPHIPDDPAVAGMPEVADSPEVADMADVALAPDVVMDMGVAVAGGTAPLSVMPPPS